MWMTQMGVASLDGAISEVSGQGCLEITWSTRVKQGARLAHCRCTPHRLPFSTLSPSLTLFSHSRSFFQGQWSLNQNIGSLLGKGAYLPVWDSKIIQSKGPKRPAVSVAQNPRKHTLWLHLPSWPHGSFQTYFTPPSPPDIVPLACSSVTAASFWHISRCLFLRAPECSAPDKLLCARVSLSLHSCLAPALVPLSTLFWL